MVDCLKAVVPSQFIAERGSNLVVINPGRIDLQRKLFCSIQLIGGVGLTLGLVPVMEERVLHSIPANEAIDTFEVLQSRTDPTFVSWKGGVILGILDLGWDSWIH